MSLTIFSSNAQTKKTDWQSYNQTRSLSADESYLNQIPHEYLLQEISIKNFQKNLKSQAANIWLPEPDGSFSEYHIIPTKTVADEVAHLYTIKTFRGYKISDPSVTLACDISETGFHTAVFNGQKTFFIEPYSKSEEGVHISYYKNKIPDPEVKCGLHDHATEKVNEVGKTRNISIDQKLTLRLALVASGEYAQQFGGSPYSTTNVLNALAAGVNIVNAIYVRDIGVEFILVTTPALIFPDPNLDPFDTSNQNQLLDDCHETCTTFLGSHNFDIGHLVVWDLLGGLAGIGVVCNDGRKGYGFSGYNGSLSTLWVDFVCHEIGHQFNALHNFAADECGQADKDFLYEPGEGSSIMCYAGACGPPVQYATTSDPYFHYASIERMREFITLDGNCVQVAQASNPFSPVASANSSIIIPKETPFVLVGTGSDDNDSIASLTYSWDQYDGDGQRTTGLPDCTSVEDPLFRFRPPTAENYRSFPEYAEVLSGNNNGVDFEKLPCVSRDMTFSFTVRDNNVDFGRVEHDTMVVTVVNTGPFQVTSPNGGESLNGSLMAPITWDENNTSSHCPRVDVLLSTDDGLTFDVIASNLPNTGSGSVVIPNTGTSLGRLMIRCTVTGGFSEVSTFYDICDDVFTIIPAALPDVDMDGYDISVDCDDNNFFVNPGAPEVCNGIDDDCDLLIDDADPNAVGLTTYYLDFDGDGFGDPLSPMGSCTTLAGFVLDNTDCNDFDPMVNPAATEICNGIDDDCDGLVDMADPSLSGLAVWYFDNDNDGYGDTNNSMTSCTPPVGYVNLDGDCDDNNFNINPGATEICNNIDDDCDGLIDGNDPSLVGTAVWYRDADGDTYGSLIDFVSACTQPFGYIATTGDCDDSNININPAAQEVCNGVDDDCDGLIDANDPSVIGASTWFRDSDGDSYGDPNNEVLACTQPFGFVFNNQDCNDNNAFVNPAGQEICNGIDDDCDGLVDTADPSLSGTLTWYADFDGDGYGNPLAPVQACNQPTGHVVNNSDCDDTNSNINPSAIEICNGVDDDCDGLIDDQDPSLSGANILYADADMDGYGDPNISIVSCNPVIGYVNNSSDCDDTNQEISPSALEICNGIDDDCDGLIDQTDPSITNLTIWYADLDGDGYGNAQNQLEACQRPTGFVDAPGDCNDGDPAINPLSPEICNGIDDDCDGLVDSNDPSLSGDSNWYADADNDGYGNPSVMLSDCNQPAGYVANNLDCDDGNNMINPGQQEICNGIDDDCDGLTDMADPDNIGGSTWFADNDGDDYGDASNTLIACERPLGYTSNNTDCNDTNPLINPGGQETCNGFDDDCDGLVDNDDPDNQGDGLWYQDNDNDGYGNNAEVINSCTQPVGYVAAPGDCNDTDSSINPLQTEICNGIDDDCDGLIDGNDPDLVSNNTWYADNDGDGYGHPTNSVQDCTQPAGYVANNQDCDDNNSAVNPNGLEVCNNIDDDCDGLVDGDDPDVNNALNTWYEDSDGDGFGNLAVFISSCDQPAGYVSNGTDCNDSNQNIFPGSPEICNGVDDDCDGLTDSADPDYQGTDNTYYRDADGDGFGDSQNSLSACSPPTGYVLDDSDCDDTNDTVNPNGQEVCNGLDDDCDGLLDGADPDNQGGDSTYYEDADEDGYGNAQNSIIACTQPAGYVLDNTDCDDTDTLINPGAQEVCNGKDDDCNGLTDMDDPGLAGVGLWFADLDEDGYGDESNTVLSCTQPDGYTFDNNDCDDNDPNINPDAIEICNDIDDNCDGLTDDQDPNLETNIILYRDADEDGYGDNENSVAACNDLTGFVDNNEDCDDENPNINPGTEEILGNGIDDDCDGFVDEVTDATEELAKLSFEVYPNPAIEYITVNSELLQRADIRILNTQGQVVFIQDELILPGKIDISTINAGAYLLELKETESQRSSLKKIIKF